MRRLTLEKVLQARKILTDSAEHPQQFVFTPREIKAFFNVDVKSDQTEVIISGMNIHIQRSFNLSDVLK